MKKLAFGIATLALFATQASAQQFPILDRVAAKVVQKYRNESCGEIMASRDQPKSPEEQNVLQMLHSDPQMRQEFINRVAAPIANKLFECHMIP